MQCGDGELDGEAESGVGDGEALVVRRPDGGGVEWTVQAHGVAKRVFSQLGARLEEGAVVG